jgi:UDP-glucose 4-epimerase
MKILATGGAGYVGSNVVRLLRDSGHDVVVLDDLRQGHRAAVGDVPLVEGDVADRHALERARELVAFDAVVHLAADCLVGESVKRPERYYRNNFLASLQMVEHLRQMGVEQLVFSSTAATYGEPQSLPIEEEHPTRPSNPYGETKLAFERALHWAEKAHGFRAIALRYFNAAGAGFDGELGEDHRPETHLIPRVLSVALGKSEALSIHGHDYPTPDGTCVRDYVHVEDLARAHLLALQSLAAGAPGRVFNLGSEAGYSVQQVVEVARAVTGAELPVEMGDRRPGDPPSLVANSRRIQQELGWRPRLGNLDDIVRSAWAWHRRNPEGYEGRR